MTRFDDFLERTGITVFAVDQFAGFSVEVGLPPSWELFNSAVGVRVWVCRTDPPTSVFAANAVLTMHCVKAALDAHEVFTMLVEQQLQSVPQCAELHRDLAAATEGTGSIGVLAMQIAHELGTIESVSRSRIITAEQETLIAQLTVTALRTSPVDLSHIWMSVRTGAVAGSMSAGHHAGVPATGTRDVRQ